MAVQGGGDYCFGNHISSHTFHPFLGGHFNWIGTLIRVTVTLFSLI